MMVGLRLQRGPPCLGGPLWADTLPAPQTARSQNTILVAQEGRSPASHAQQL